MTIWIVLMIASYILGGVCTFKSLKDDDVFSNPSKKENIIVFLASVFWIVIVLIGSLCFIGVVFSDIIFKIISLFSKPENK